MARELAHMQVKYGNGNNNNDSDNQVAHSPSPAFSSNPNILSANTPSMSQPSGVHSFEGRHTLSDGPNGLESPGFDTMANYMAPGPFTLDT